jgi:hypothetical protein
MIRLEQLRFQSRRRRLTDRNRRLVLAIEQIRVVLKSLAGALSSMTAMSHDT